MKMEDAKMLPKKRKNAAEDDASREPSRYRLSRQDKETPFSTSSGAFQLPANYQNQTSDIELDKQQIINQLEQMPFDMVRAL